MSNTVEAEGTVKVRLDGIFAELREAHAALEQAMNAESEARRETVRCRNRVNEAQKAWDKLATELRETSPPGSDWFNVELERR